MIKNAVKKELKTSIRGRVYFDRLFEDHTYFRIGGPALAWVEPVDLADLESAVGVCNKLKLPVFIFGKGSNVLAADSLVKKLVIQLSSEFFKKISYSGNKITAASGVALSDVLNGAVRRGLGGLEFLAGIPGTIGGAVAMNAGSARQGIGKYVEWVRTMDYDAKIQELEAEDLKFGYRESNLYDKIILEVRFGLKKSKPALLKRRFREFLDKKKKMHEFRYPNAGCIFKNPDSSSWTAGRLIESVGLKGKRIGDAQFSKIHANFIINLGHATCGDVKRLMKLAQDEVKKTYNLWLEPEVKIIS